MSNYNWGNWINTTINSSSITNGSSDTTGGISNSGKNACQVSISITYGSPATEGVEVYLLVETSGSYETVVEDQFEYRMPVTVSSTESDTINIDMALSGFKVHLINNSGATVTATVTYRQAADGVSGGNTVTITLKETDTNGDPVPDAIVTIRDATDSIALDEDTTDAAGQATFYLNDGTYKIYPRKQGSFTFNDPETLTVSGTTSQEYYGTAFSVNEPTSPSLCTVYGWVYDVDGTALLGAIVTATTLPKQFTVGDLGVNIDTTTATTDSSGYFSLQLLKQIYYKLEIQSQGYAKTVLVPSATSSNYADL